MLTLKVGIAKFKYNYLTFNLDINFAKKIIRNLKPDQQYFVEVIFLLSHLTF